MTSPQQPFEIVYASTQNQRDDSTLVSVIVTSFNYARYIEQTLESIRLQQHARIELLLVDDASTDESLDVILAWLEIHNDRFELIKVFHATLNRGVGWARNLAFAHASGGAVMVMDADNMLEPRAISRLLEALTDTGCAFAYSQLLRFGDDYGLGLANTWSRERLAIGNYIDAMALIAKKAWAQVGGYQSEDRGGWEDYDLWCRFADADLSGVFVPEILCRYRVHSTSMLRTREKEFALHQSLVHLMIADHPWLLVRP